MNTLTLDEINTIIKPIDRPVRAFHIGFNYIEKWLENEDENIPHGINLNPDFQRGHVWTVEQQSHFIENVLRGLVDESGLTIRFNCPSWQNEPDSKGDLLDQMVCIDGLQRLTAIRQFMSGEMCPFGLHIDQLKKLYVGRKYQISAKFYDFQYRKDLLQFYLDINSGGTQHTDCELDRVRQLLNGVDV